MVESNPYTFKILWRHNNC